MPIISAVIQKTGFFEENGSKNDCAKSQIVSTWRREDDICTC